MSASRGIRTGAVVGTVGGAVRAAGSFAPRLIASDDARTWLYVGIDICLALGLVSLYLARRQGMRRAGILGSFLGLAARIEFTQGRGLGLTSMKERVRAVRGRLVIFSAPQRGTTIHASVPLGGVTDEPVAEIVQGGEPFSENRSESRTGKRSKF